MSRVKCVAWDLDDTVWPGVAIESDVLPEPHERVLGLLAELERRGVVNSVASRGDPAFVAGLRAHPRLAGVFVAPQVSWDPKSVSMRRIARELNISLEAIAFVDEDPFERAEVGHLAPEVLVLSVSELEEALDGPAFTTGMLTDEGRRRVQLYREEERRRAVRDRFAGGQVEFLRWCEMRLTIGPAEEADLGRLVELAERTHRLNSTGQRHTPDDVRRWHRDDRWLLTRARLADRFGDYGTIGLAAAERDTLDWRIELLAISCRVEGRGIPAALLRWLMDQARESGAGGITARYQPNGRNLRLGLLLRQLGFRRASAGELRRTLAGPLPDYPPWLQR
jgi:methoxymalonate biosynthesis protein